MTYINREPSLLGSMKESEETGVRVKLSVWWVIELECCCCCCRCCRCCWSWWICCFKAFFSWVTWDWTSRWRWWRWWLWWLWLWRPLDDSLWVTLWYLIKNEWRSTSEAEGLETGFTSNRLSKKSRARKRKKNK